MRNVTPLATSAPRTPATAISTPPTVGPAVPCKAIAIPIREFAATMSRSGTRTGTALRPTGLNAVASTEAEATSTSRIGKGGSRSAIAP